MHQIFLLGHFIFFLFMYAPINPKGYSAYAQTDFTSSGVAQEIIANGQVLIIDGHTYVVEKVIGTEGNNPIVSLIPQENTNPALGGAEEKQVTRTFLEYPSSDSRYPYQFINQDLFSKPEAMQSPLVIKQEVILSEGLVLFEEKSNELTYVIRGNYLGSGGFNDVYEGRYIDAQGRVKQVAIKQGRSKWGPELGRYKSVHSLEDQKMLASGAMSAKELDPEIAVEVFAAGVAKIQNGAEVSVSVMDLQKGVTLEQYVQKQFGKSLEAMLSSPDQSISRPAWDFLLELQPQMERILSGLNNSQLVHGDIKPGNLLVEIVNGELRLKLTDFDTMGKVGTLTDAATINYLHPNELYKMIKGEHVTRTIDLDRYAMQATLHKIVFGSVPYQRLMKNGQLTQLLQKVGLYKTSDAFFQQMNIINGDIGNDWQGLLDFAPASEFSKTNGFLSFATPSMIPTSIPPIDLFPNPKMNSSQPRAASKNLESTQPIRKVSTPISTDSALKLIEGLPKCLSK